MSEVKPKVFISHSWEDNEIAKKLEENLRRDGVEIWVDYDKVKAGDSFIDKMEEGLKWCNTLILLWSNSAAKSTWVKREWQGVLTGNIKIIPCLIDDKGLPLILRNLLYIDLSNFDEGYSGLAKDLNLVIKEEKQKEVKTIVITTAETAEKKHEIYTPKKTVLRSNPQTLTEDDAKNMLKKYGFYCKDDPISKKYSNPDQKGNIHKYKFQKINGDQIVYDNTTDLIWQKSGSLEEMSFDDATNWIKELNQNAFAELMDWRLPTLEEAMSLMETKQKNGNLYIDPIFDKKQVVIWTADKDSESSASWIVDFQSGNCNNFFDIVPNFCIYVRAVCSLTSSKEKLDNLTN